MPLGLFTEEDLENMTMGIFWDLEYETLDGYHVDRDYHEVLLEQYLFDDLKK